MPASFIDTNILLHLASSDPAKAAKAEDIAAAVNAGCETLWSEDMHHGLVVENTLRIVNPFRAAA